MEDVFHTLPAMKVPDAMNRLDQIENRNVQALGGLHGDRGNLRFYRENNGQNAFKIEWGVAKEQGFMNPDCILISGHEKGVEWKPFLDAGLVPLAHSHPFHRDRALADRGVLWDDINGSSPNQNLTARLKVFPSAGDFAFCAAQGLATHIVKTPYCVVKELHPKIVWIVNPDVAHFAAALRLHFRIFDVVELNRGHYRGQLEAMCGNQIFWHKRDVHAYGGGGGGLTF